MAHPDHGAAPDPFDVPMPRATHLLITEAKHERLGDEMKLVCLGGPMLTKVLHWTRGRHLPCQADAGECPLCRLGNKEKRWYGFLPVVERNGRKPWWLRVTQYGALAAPHLLNKRVDLRGALVIVRRVGATSAKPGKQLVSVQLGFALPETIPEAFNLRQVLEDMWSAESNRSPAQADDVVSPLVPY